MADKILSIIVPSYNMEQYLPKCLGSLVVAPEMMDRLEVLVVNDGSKDRTSEIAHEFAEKWPGTFKVIDKENGNYGSAVNAGLRVATGFYVKILDADDTVDTLGFCELLRFCKVQSVRGAAAVDLIVTNYQTVTVDGKLGPCKTYSDALPQRTDFTLDNIPEDSPRFQLFGIVYRLSMIRSLGYVQTEGVSYTDTEWIILPMAGVAKAAYLPVSGTNYLVGRDGQTMNPATFARNFSMLSKVVVNLVECFERYKKQGIIQESAYTYVKAQVFDMIRFVYLKNVFGASGYRVNDDLNAFEENLERVSEIIYKESEDIVLQSRVFPLRVVKIWRCWRTKYAPTYIAFRAYQAVLRLVR